MTTLQLRRLRAYNAAGWNDCQIADELGLTVGTVYYWRRLKLGLPAHRDASHKRLRDYTVYDRHGNVAAFGTARECARALGVKVETIYRLASRSAGWSGSARTGFLVLTRTKQLFGVSINL